MEMDKSTRRKAPGVLDQRPSASGVQKGGPQEGSEREEAPQSPWLSPKEIEEAVEECVGGNCRRVKEIIRMARLKKYDTYADVPPLALITGGFIVNTLRSYLSIHRIIQIIVVNWHVLRRLLRLGYVFEFSQISEFRPRSLFDAYWMYTSLVTLKLPFIVRSRFDPINEDVCTAFGDEGLCHMFITGYLIAEAKKSNPSRRFKEVGTSHPVTVALLLSIAKHFAVEHGIVTKTYIDERKREVYFILDDLPEDVKRFVGDAWENPTTLTKLANEEFMTLLAGLIAGDGAVTRSSGNVEVALSGNLEREKSLYVVVQGELKRRLRVEAYLRERKNSNAIELLTWGYDTVRLLRMLPPLIEPLKELRRHVVLNKDKLSTHLAGKLFDLLGDEKKNGEKGIYGLQSYQAIRFLTTLTRLRLIRLKEVQGRRYHILETPTNPRGRSPSGSPRRTAHPPVPARVRAGS